MWVVFFFFFKSTWSHIYGWEYCYNLAVRKAGVRIFVSRQPGKNVKVSLKKVKVRVHEQVTLKSKSSH